MKKSIIILGIFLLLGCGKEKVTLQGLDGKNGVSCSTTQETNGVLVSCEDGSTSFIFNGVNGSDGYNSLISMTGLHCAYEVCESGKGVLLASGLDTNRNNVLDESEMNENSISVVCDGAVGPQGPSGSSGENGDSCSLQEVENGVTITCGEDSATVYNGVNGENSATLSSYSLNGSCQSVGNGFYAKLFGGTTKLYDDSDCGSHDFVTSLGNSADEVYITGDLMFIAEGMKLFKITF